MSTVDEPAGPDTNLPWWDGATPDYDWIISSLFSEPRTPRPDRTAPAEPIEHPASIGA